MVGEGRVDGGERVHGSPVSRRSTGSSGSSGGLSPVQKTIERLEQEPDLGYCGKSLLSLQSQNN